MPIEVIELGKDGTYTTMPEPGDSWYQHHQCGSGAGFRQTGCLLTMWSSAPTPVPATGEERLAAAPEPVEADEPDAPAETPITADYVNKRISRLTARHRTAEKALAG